MHISYKYMLYWPSLLIVKLFRVTQFVFKYANRLLIIFPWATMLTFPAAVRKQTLRGVVIALHIVASHTTKLGLLLSFLQILQFAFLGKYTRKDPPTKTLLFLSCYEHPSATEVHLWCDADTKTLTFFTTSVLVLLGPKCKVYPRPCPEKHFLVDQSISQKGETFKNHSYVMNPEP